MRTGTAKRLALSAALLFALTRVSAALDLYTRDFEADPVGVITRPNNTLPYEFHGDAGVVLSEEITASDGVAGSRSYKQSITATGAPYFYSGFGDFAVDFNDLPTGPDANNAAMYRFSADVKVVGNVNSTPVQFVITGSNIGYEAEQNIDVNNDGDFLDDATVYEQLTSPTIAASNQYTHISFTFNQAAPSQTLDPDIRPQDRVFSNSLSLLWQGNFNSGGFGVDAGNTVSVDNIKIEFLGQVPAGLLGDYNGNQVVDAADYTVWRDRLGGTTLTNESATPGTVDVEDYNYWKAHFGESNPGAGQGQLSPNAVPEPTTGLLVIGGLITACFLPRRSPAR